MRNKNIIAASIVLLVLVILLWPKVSAWQTQRRMQHHAQELRRAISATMLDISQAKGGSIAGANADGQWYQSVEFDTKQYGHVSYEFDGDALLRRDGRGSQVIARRLAFFGVRRKPAEKLIVEVRITMKQAEGLKSNFRVRVQE